MKTIIAKKHVFDWIWKLGQASKADLMQRLTDELVTDKLVLVTAFGQSTGGRKPIIYCVNDAYGAVLGLEISRFSSSLGLYDLAMKPIAFERWKMTPGMTPHKLLNKIERIAERMLQAGGVARERLLGIGVGAVGPLSRETGMILQPRHFPAAGWSQVPITELLEQRLGIPAKLDNGANTALVGEHWALRSKEVEHMVYVHAGIGLRTAMLSGGKIVRGAIDMEGSFGQMIIQTSGTAGALGSGTLESLVAIPALEQRIHEQLAASGQVAESSRSFDNYVQALRRQEPLITAAFMDTATNLGIGIANLINILHPEAVILGGPLVNAHQMLYDKVVAVARSHIYYSPDYEPLFSQGQLKEDAVSAGAAVMLLQEWNLS
jgi:predicted NBD/HSP70 family sugar kinase